MERKTVLTGEDARQALVNGANIVADAVKVTLGAGGSNVMISQPNKPGASGIVTKDGVTVAKAVYVDDPWEAEGAKLIQSIARSADNAAGDGTTTATVIAQALLRQGTEILNTGGVNGIRMKAGMEQALKEITETLRNNAIPVTDNLADVATIAANGDVELGKLIAEAVSTSGDEGVINTKGESLPGYSLTSKKGCTFEESGVPEYFLKRGEETRTLRDAMVLVTDLTVDHLNQFQYSNGGNFLRNVVNEQRTLVIIAPEFSADVFAALYQLHIVEGARIYPVKAPSFGKKQDGALEDITAITGAKFLSAEMKHNFSQIDGDTLGQGLTVDVSRDKITFSTTDEDWAEREDQVEYLKKLRADVTDENDVKLLTERIARLTGKVMTLTIGGHNTQDVDEKIDRVVDAVNATKAAAKSGIVPGGGVALRDMGIGDREGIFKNDSELAGYNLVYDCLSVPHEIILENAGMGLTEVVEGRGLNVVTGKVGDMVEMGIIDPVDVTISSLSNAVGVASIVLTTRAVVLPEFGSSDLVLS